MEPHDAPADAPAAEPAETAPPPSTPVPDAAPTPAPRGWTRAEFALLGVIAACAAVAAGQLASLLARS